MCCFREHTDVSCAFGRWGGAVGRFAGLPAGRSVGRSILRKYVPLQQGLLSKVLPNVYGRHL
eukprot:4615663-Lingulodinium_polyedra.AAC.1